MKLKPYLSYVAKKRTTHTMRFLLLSLLGLASGLQLPPVSRRTFFTGAVGSSASLLVVPAFADDASASLKPLYKAAMFSRKSRRYMPGEQRTSDDFEQGMDSPFVGTYSDPFHPEGIRTVSLKEEKIGEFRQATIAGNDGPGSPAFSLPALVYSDQITVDFRPKGGPESLTGIFSGNGIKWPDGNKWPLTSK